MVYDLLYLVITMTFRIAKEILSLKGYLLLVVLYFGLSTVLSLGA